MHTSKEPVKISSQTNGLAFLPRQNFNESIIYNRAQEPGYSCLVSFFHSMTPYPLNYELLYRRIILYALGSKGQNDVGNQSHYIYSKDVPLRRKVILKSVFLNTKVLCVSMYIPHCLNCIPCSFALILYKLLLSTNFLHDVIVFSGRYKV